jgi:hypothetical protein
MTSDERPRVVHCKREPYDVLIDRTTKWGNPFRIHANRTRERAVSDYRAWINREYTICHHYDKTPTKAEIQAELRGKVLGCWCAPKACHGDVLLEIANDPN